MNESDSDDFEYVKKILISIPNYTLERISILAKENGMTRSAMINYALKWYLDYKNSMDIMPALLDLIKLKPEELSKFLNKEN